MRISDWSSDVCSSDLPEVAQILEHSGSRPGIQRNRVTILSYISSGQNRSDTIAAVPAKSWDNFPFWFPATAAVLSKILHYRRIFLVFLFLFICLRILYLIHYFRSYFLTSFLHSLF